jgi:WD40 repeat protein/serine/threonine protein kinase
MSGDEGKSLDDRLAEVLAEFDDLLAAGREASPDEMKESVDPALLPEWNRLTAFLTLVESAWPRGREDPDLRTEAVSTGSVETGPEVGTGPPEVEGTNRFGRFEIRQTLGQGGFGVVFLAWDPALRRQVALKVPQPEALVAPEARKRFLREAHAAATLDHPNIVPVYESGSVGSVAYIASAYCPGLTLAEWLARRSQPVPPREAAGLIATLAQAVAHAHERGVLHRDLKPSNVLLQGPGAPDPSSEEALPLADLQPRITDFSLAWLADGEGPKTRSGIPIGSPPYMAPEQAEGRLQAIGPRTDVYGLGCILYEVLIGRAPFSGASQLETLRQVLTDEPIPPRRHRKEIPIPLEAIVLKCLEKDAARRYAGARELADDLARFRAGEPTKARPPGSWEIIRRRARRHSAALLVLAMGLVLLATLLSSGFWIKTRLDQDRRDSIRRAEEARLRGQAERQAQYVADIRRVNSLIEDHNTPRALELLRRQRPRPGEQDRRGFAWRYLRGRADTSRRTLRGFTDQVYWVEFSPRGDLLAATGKDGSVRIWDTTTWRLICAFTASPTEVNAGAFAPDGKILATVGDEGKLKLWELATGQLQREIPAHTGDAVIARFTPDGKTIVTGGRDDGQIKLWDRASGKLLDHFRASDRNLENATLSPDGSILACVGGGVNNLWKLSDRREPRSFGADGVVQGISFSNDGHMLATAHETLRVARLWDLSANHLLHEVRGHTDGVFTVVFSRDNRMIISAGSDRTIRLWDVATGEPRGLHQGHVGKIWNLAISPDGRVLASASGDRTVKLWDTEPPRDHETILLNQPVAAMRFAPDGRTLAFVEKDGTFSLLEMETKTRQRHQALDLPSNPQSGPRIPGNAAISVDLRAVLTADSQGAVGLWDTDDGRRKAGLGTSDISAVPPSVGITPDGHYGYAVHHRRRVEFWDLKTGRLVSKVEGDYVALVFLRGDRLLIGDTHDRPLLWEPLQGRIREPTRRPFRPQCWSLSPDGRVLAFQNRWPGESATRELQLWDTEHWLPSGISIRTPVDIVALAFDSSGRTLVGGGVDGNVRLWNLASGEELLILKGHSGWVDRIHFSPDGKTLATHAGRPDDKSVVFLWHTVEDDSVMAAEAHGSTTNPAH